MPVFERANIRFDPDAAPGDVVTVGLRLAKEKHASALHHHRKAQCLMAISGVLTCEAAGGIWIVPPQTALWIPPGVPHRLTFSGHAEGYNAFIEPALAQALPERCCSLTVSPLLRELMIRSAQSPSETAGSRFQTLLSALLLEEILTSQRGHLHLPMPNDPRLRSVFSTMMAAPSDRRTMADWAAQISMSERSFARLVVAETGMSFGRWHRQFSIMLAIQQMASGASLQQVTDALGYESISSFVTMFRKAMGTSPGRYMARQG